MIRPEPVSGHLRLAEADKRSDPSAVAVALVQNEYFLVTDFFSTGLTILAALRHSLGGDKPRNSYSAERAYRTAFQDASQRLLAPVRNNRLNLRKAPEIGWLKELYPDTSQFVLPFPQVQGLNSAWQWFQKGATMPVLRRRLHPFYGTYFPSRFEHLRLFADWLKEYRGKKDFAIDVGTGCGVLAFQLSEVGWPRVLATDINPNAVESVRRELARAPGQTEIQTQEADLLGTGGEPADLIVFNPPWLPGDTRNSLDLAMYYPEDLFDRFFKAAIERLAPEGRVVLIFSNLQEAAGLGAEHPVQRELNTGGRFKLVRRVEGKVGPASATTKRRKRSPWRERVELWELKAERAS